MEIETAKSYNRSISVETCKYLKVQAVIFCLPYNFPRKTYYQEEHFLWYTFQSEHQTPMDSKL